MLATFIKINFLSRILQQKYFQVFSLFCNFFIFWIHCYFTTWYCLNRDPESSSQLAKLSSMLNITWLSTQSTTIRLSSFHLSLPYLFAIISTKHQIQYIVLIEESKTEDVHFLVIINISYFHDHRLHIHYSRLVVVYLGGITLYLVILFAVMFD